MSFTPEQVVGGPVIEQAPLPEVAPLGSVPVSAPVPPPEDLPDITPPPEPPPENALLLTNGTEAQEDPLVQEVEGILGKEIDAYVKAQLPGSEPGYVQARNGLAKELVLRRGKMDPEDVVQAIEAWLKTLPGMVKIYLEQAAAIKTRELEQLFAQPLE